MLDAQGGIKQERKHGDVVLRVLSTLLILAIVGGGFFFWRVTSSTGTAQTPKSNEQDPLVTEEQVVAEPSSVLIEPGAQAPVGHDVSISLAMVGDVLMHDETIASGRMDDGTFNYNHLFAHVADEIAGVDVAMVNQETILGGPEIGGGFTGFPLFNSPQEVGEAEVAAGFDVVLKATNHTLDQGYRGLHSEMAYWGLFHPNIPVVGAADPFGEFGGYVNDVYVYDKEGFRVAILNYTWATNTGGGGDDASVVSYMSPEKIVADVARARELGADLIVACPHWGVEYGAAPSQEEHDYTNIFLQQGVDVVIGAHPHVLQPVEVVQREDGRRMVVFYSLGNFISSQVSVDRVVGGLAKVWLQKTADGNAFVSSYELLPVVTYVAGGTNYTTYPLRAFNDELASAIGNRGGLSFGSAVQRCIDVLGEGFNTETLTLWASMDAPPAAPADLMANPSPPRPPEALA